ncbi:MAG: bifunctional methylenetetrahydrofolate dehydrogenase/methenyltetrahydrofolate cyclohydrolase FolD [Ruminococcaceae bacterium]|nr:bifunctional methylenetetrahydrofolate dehydrogenase/methenyltetrahydrofolate cyclohydrolase FolD [Oscillospiraceae bacterium]
MAIIDGKAISAQIRSEIKAEAEALTAKGVRPGLAVILVGTDPASQIYVRNKQKACEEVGFYSDTYTLAETTTEKELLDLIEILNLRKDIHGILVQSPVPKHINPDTVINAILPEKDVDCFHPENVGKLMTGNPRFLPCTPAGVVELIKRSGVDISGKECVVVGRSNIVGKPQAIMLLAENGTVTVCHSRTKNLAEVTRRADILVVAIGKSEFITGDMVKPGAVVLDVGMNRNSEGKLTGDVNFAEVSEIASLITPVPGGVGPMTITMLLQNTITAAKAAL